MIGRLKSSLRLWNGWQTSVVRYYCAKSNNNSTTKICTSNAIESITNIDNRTSDPFEALPVTGKKKKKKKKKKKAQIITEPEATDGTAIDNVGTLVIKTNRLLLSAAAAAMDKFKLERFEYVGLFGPNFRTRVIDDVRNFLCGAVKADVIEMPNLTSDQRMYVHSLAKKFGVKTISRGKGTDRVLLMRRENSKLGKAYIDAIGQGVPFDQFLQSLNTNGSGWGDLSAAGGGGDGSGGFGGVIYDHTVIYDPVALRLNPKQTEILTEYHSHCPLSETERNMLHEVNQNPKTETNQSDRIPRYRPIVPPEPRYPLDSSLPAYPIRSKIVKTIRQSQVTLVTGETGCGKTTQVPQYLLEDARERVEPVYIVCTQPRRLPATAVARRVAQERGEPLGDTVGYHIRFDRSMTHGRTNLLFCTAGVLLKTLMDGDAPLNNLTHIILDEVHERGQITDFLLTHLKRKLLTGDFPHLRVILMSATMSEHISLFQDYFKEFNPGRVHIKCRMFQVDEYYLDDILRLTTFNQAILKRGEEEFGKKRSELLKDNPKYSRLSSSFADPGGNNNRQFPSHHVLQPQPQQPKNHGQNVNNADINIADSTATEQWRQQIQSFASVGQGKQCEANNGGLKSGGTEKSQLPDTMMQSMIQSILLNEPKPPTTTEQDEAAATKQPPLFQFFDQNQLPAADLSEPSLSRTISSSTEDWARLRPILGGTTGTGQQAASTDDSFISQLFNNTNKKDGNNSSFPTADIKPNSSSILTSILSSETTKMSGSGEPTNSFDHHQKQQSGDISQLTRRTYGAASPDCLSIASDNGEDSGNNYATTATNSGNNYAAATNSGNYAAAARQGGAGFSTTVSFSSSSEESADDDHVDRATIVEDKDPVDPIQDELRRLRETCLMEEYWRTRKNDRVDVPLLLSLIQALVPKVSSKGSILVFLPGMDDISSVRDGLMNSKDGRTNKMIILTLHSQISDDPSVSSGLFHPPPGGKAKVILSTNIAEASITIKDVLYVIDSGKVKEKNYLAAMETSCLDEVFISRSSAIQRKGRAGRCTHGSVYRLYSRQQYERMPPTAVPEMLRVPIYEVCLKAKMIIGNEVTIEDFLSSSPAPPETNSLHNAIKFLQTLEALDENENLTELGRYLSEISVGPQMGIFLLHGILLRCLDPVLSIAATISHRDPYILPSIPDDRERLKRQRAELLRGYYSDHYGYYLAVSQYQKSGGGHGGRSRICHQLGLNQTSMDMIIGIRRQMVRDLERMNILGGGNSNGDMRALNENSDSWPIVKACIAAACYPYLAYTDYKAIEIKTRFDAKARIHPGSPLYDQLPPPDTDLNYLGYNELTRLNRGLFLKTVTAVSGLTVSMFSGSARMDPVNEAQILRGTKEIRPAAAAAAEPSSSLRSNDDRQRKHDENGGGPEETPLTEHKNGLEQSSTTMINNPPDDQHSSTAANDFNLGEIIMRIPQTDARLLYQIRQKWKALYVKKLCNWRYSLSWDDQLLIRTLREVLTEEDIAKRLEAPPEFTQHFGTSANSAAEDNYRQNYEDDLNTGGCSSSSNLLDKFTTSSGKKLLHSKHFNKIGRRGLTSSSTSTASSSSQLLNGFANHVGSNNRNNNNNRSSLLLLNRNNNNNNRNYNNQQQQQRRNNHNNSSNRNNWDYGDEGSTPNSSSSSTNYHHHRNNHNNYYQEQQFTASSRNYYSFPQQTQQQSSAFSAAPAPQQPTIQSSQNSQVTAADSLPFSTLTMVDDSNETYGKPPPPPPSSLTTSSLSNNLHQNPASSYPQWNPASSYPQWGTNNGSSSAEDYYYYATTNNKSPVIDTFHVSYDSDYGMWNAGGGVGAGPFSAIMNDYTTNSSGSALSSTAATPLSSSISANTWSNSIYHNAAAATNNSGVGDAAAYYSHNQNNGQDWTSGGGVGDNWGDNSSQPQRSYSSSFSAAAAVGDNNDRNSEMHYCSSSSPPSFGAGMTSASHHSSSTFNNVHSRSTTTTSTTQFSNHQHNF